MGKMEMIRFSFFLFSSFFFSFRGSFSGVGCVRACVSGFVSGREVGEGSLVKVRWVCR